MPRLPALENLARDVCLSNVFTFRQFRTLFYPERSRGVCNGALATPLPSITSALFPMQRKGEGIFADPGARLSPLTSASSCKFAPLLSTTCRMLFPQHFSFHVFALLPGVGGRPLKTVQKITPSLTTRGNHHDRHFESTSVSNSHRRRSPRTHR